MTIRISGFVAAGLTMLVAAPALAAVPTPAVCKSFAQHAIRWNTEARSYQCKLPNMPNMHFREGDIYKWCMSRPNDDRNPQALGHKGLLQKSCPRYGRAS